MPPKTTASIGQPEDPSKKGFLDLAAETRNQIYGYWADDIDNFFVRAQGRAYTTASHPATSISRTIHREFTGLLGQLAPTNAHRVKVLVVDLNFYPLMTYINRVIANPDADWRRFVSPDEFWPDPNSCVLIVDLVFTKNFWRNPAVDKVSTWFRFLNRKVPKLDYGMRVVEVEDERETTEVIDRMMLLGDPGDMWRRIVQSYRDWGATRRWQLEMVGQWPAPPAAEERPELAGLQQEVHEWYNGIYAAMDGDVKTEVKIED